MFLVPLLNHWSKVIYSQEHCSPVLKSLSFESFNWISGQNFGNIEKVGGLELSEKIFQCFTGEIFHISVFYIYFRQFCVLFPNFKYIALNQHQDLKSLQLSFKKKTNEFMGLAFLLAIETRSICSLPSPIRRH